MIGFNSPTNGGLNDGKRKAVYIPAGVMIPCKMGGLVRYIQVRRLDGKRDKDGKPVRYEKVTGSGHGLYLTDKMRGQPDVFVVEGEFDALLLWQVIGDLADVITLGSASGRMDVEWVPFLLSGLRFYVATDNDANGEVEARHWLELVGKRGVRVLPPAGAKDVNEAWLSGVDVRAWAIGCMASHLGAALWSETETITVLWPSYAPIGCPVGRWRRLESGEIEAEYTRDELELAVALEIVRRPAGTKGFKVLPRRGLVERSFGWFGRYRRLSKDFEHQPRSYTS